MIEALIDLFRKFFLGETCKVKMPKYNQDKFNSKINEMLNFLRTHQINSAYSLIIEEYQKELNSLKIKEEKLKELEAQILALKYVYVDNHLAYCQELKDVASQIFICEEGLDDRLGASSSRLSNKIFGYGQSGYYNNLNQISEPQTSEPEDAFRRHSDRMVSEPSAEPSSSKEPKTELSSEPKVDQRIIALMEDLKLKRQKQSWEDWIDELTEDAKHNLEISDDDTEY